MDKEEYLGNILQILSKYGISAECSGELLSFSKNMHTIPTGIFLEFQQKFAGVLRK